VRNSKLQHRRLFTRSSLGPEEVGVLLPERKTWAGAVSDLVRVLGEKAIEEEKATEDDERLM
jgi:hypothetical protein